MVLCEPPMKQTAVSDGTGKNRNERLIVGKECGRLSAFCCRLVREGLGMKWQAVNSLRCSSCLCEGLQYLRNWRRALCAALCR